MLKVVPMVTTVLERVNCS